MDDGAPSFDWVKWDAQLSDIIDFNTSVYTSKQARGRTMEIPYIRVEQGGSKVEKITPETAATEKVYD